MVVGEPAYYTGIHMYILRQLLIFLTMAATVQQTEKYGNNAFRLVYYTML